jgi:hypothetical protein
MVVLKNFENEARSSGLMEFTSEGRRCNYITSSDSIGGSPEGGRKPIGKSDALIVFENPLIE